MSSETEFLLPTSAVRFVRDAEGTVQMRVEGKARTVGSMAMVSPLSNPSRMVVVRDEEGEEIGVLDNIHELDAQSMRIVKEELEKAYFMPRILDVLSVKEILGVVTWKVETDRGPRTFEVQHIRQNIRHIGRSRVIIRDVDGNRYEIRNWHELPPRARIAIEQYI